jgi:uncharacterized protein YbaA (DUF1428 family)
MYVDGSLVPVKSAQREAYRKVASEAAAVWKDHGATQVIEAWGDECRTAR